MKAIVVYMTDSDTVEFRIKHISPVSLTGVKLVIFPPAVVDTVSSSISRSYIFACIFIKCGEGVFVIWTCMGINNCNFSGPLHSCFFQIVIILQWLQICAICFGCIVLLPIPCVCAACTHFIDHIQNCSCFCLSILYRNAYWRCGSFRLYFKRNRQKQKHGKTKP